MKAIIALTLLAGLSAQANAPVIEETLLECQQMTSPNGRPLLGVSAPKIVRFPYDSSFGKDFYVKTKVVRPGATPNFTKLKNVSNDAEGSVWESKTYSLEVKIDGTGVLSKKPGKSIKAVCIAPTAK